MTRADACAFPLLMDQPVSWRIGEFESDKTQRFGSDELRFSEQSRALCCGQGAWGS